MAAPRLEVADIFRRHGEAYLAAHAGRLSLGQLKVVSAIRACRTAALGGHVARCDGCGHVEIAYNSCRNRHCPKCQGAAARAWLDKRQADLLPVAYYHVVFTLPAAIAAIAFQNKASHLRPAHEDGGRDADHDRRRSEAARRQDRLHQRAAHVGLCAHPSSARPYHRPRRRPVARRPTLDRLQAKASSCPCACSRDFFRRRFLEGLTALHEAGRLAFFGDLAELADPGAFKTRLAPLRRVEWVVYAKRPFGGPEAVLAYLSRYTHRVAISDSRLVAFDGQRVAFRWKDYRIRATASGAWIKTMTLPVDEFMRRFLLHVLPDGFHRIRHYGFLAGAARADTVARIRDMIDHVHPTEEVAQPTVDEQLGDDNVRTDTGKERACPCCGGRMTLIERFVRGAAPQTPSAAAWSDTS